MIEISVHVVISHLILAWKSVLTYLPMNLSLAALDRNG